MKTLGQIRVVTLVEMDEDLRKFSLISTRILSSDEFSETVRLSSRFILENYDPVKVEWWKLYQKSKLWLEDLNCL